ncbi:MAG: galactokinase [Bdellovibrionaceae bacterium]|nr:galactokinase [Pseudobdellovibrionaceae bacterium]
MNSPRQVSSPTRVDLAGGTLDLWPLYNFVGDALTLNVAIDIYTHARLEFRDDSVITLRSRDLNKEVSYLNLKEVLSDSNPDWLLYRRVLGWVRPQSGFRLETWSESPVGGGLGGSSSLMISLLKVFEVASANVNQLVQIAHNLEASVLRTPTGTQDYYPAASGGLNILRYNASGIRQDVLPIPAVFENRFFLLYTGRSHHSGLNNFEVLKAAVAGDSVVLGALRELRKIAIDMEAALRAGDWDAFPELFSREYQARLQLTPAFTSPEITEIAEMLAREPGAALKICGAGGGGCVMVWCPPEQQKEITQKCARKFQVLNAKPVQPLV